MHASLCHVYTHVCITQERKQEMDEMYGEADSMKTKIGETEGIRQVVHSLLSSSSGSNVWSFVLQLSWTVARGS